MDCLVAVGSNLGSRQAIVRSALAELGRLPRTRLLAVSELWETPPETEGDGGTFTNAAALLRSQQPPQRLLEDLLDLERRWGRTRGSTPGRGPRTLDLDLILCGALQTDQPGLTLPHPRFRERLFVLGPAVEAAPHLRDPVSGATLRELLSRHPQMR